jgi:ABC-type microcin C transport system permease subunit YejB
MIGMTSSSVESLRAAARGHDLSWYGTLALVAACLGTLAASSLLP